jgi:outer membrane lipase/esterase
MLVTKNKRSLTRKMLAASLVLICSALTSVTQALPFSSISQVYFFGDSLSDSGFNNNITVGIPGKAPTFTTFGGYTWAQYVARDIKGFTLPTNYPAPPFSDTITNNTTPTNGPTGGAVDPVLTGINYACGGSTTNSTGFTFTWAPSLHQQVDQFISTTPVLDPNAVYFIWSGANDILTTVSSSPAPTELQLLQTANTATTNIANEVAILAQHGARRFVVMSLPNIGSTPFVNGLAASMPTLPAEMKNLSFTFDSMLNSKLGAVIKRTGVKVLYVNTYSLLDNVIAASRAGQPYVVAGVSFRFTNTTGEACAPTVSSLFCTNNGVTGYVYADSVHPTDMAHQVIALQVEALIRNWV